MKNLNCSTRPQTLCIRISVITFLFCVSFVKAFSNEGATPPATASMSADSTAPSVTCRNTAVFADANGQASVTPAAVYDSGPDNFPVHLASVSPNILECNSIGAQSVVLTVSGNSGNTATCTALVTMADTTAPTVVCKNGTLFLDATGKLGIDYADAMETIQDNCSLRQASVSPNSFDRTNIGANTVTVKVYDPSGNIGTCAAVLTIADKMDFR